MRYTLRALLAVSMLLGVYVLALGIVGALLLGVYEIVVHGLTGAFVVKLFVLAALVAVAVGRGLWAGLRRPGGDDTGVLLVEPDQPRLWSQVRHLAEQVGTRPPDEIRLIHDVNAAVSEDSRWLGLVSGTRRMYVGAPLLTGLTALQMRSVLAHELGHYGGRHTGLAGVTYRGQESLRGMIGHLGSSSLIGRILRLYARAYVAVASSVNRRQELEADECSARLAGKGVAIRALQELPAIDAGWAWFLEDYATDAAGGGRRPRELFAGFHHFWTSPEQQQRLDPLRTDPPVEQRSVYDSHPSTPERVAFLARLDTPDVPDDSGPALDLLDDAPAALRRLEEWMFEGSALTEVPWEEFASTSLAARTHVNAATLISAMELGGETKGDLGQALEAMRLGWTIDLVAPLMREDATEEHRRLAAGGLVGDLVADALIANGLACYRLSWSEGRPLVGHDGAVLDPWVLAQAAAQSPEKVPDLAEWCQEHSVPLTHRPTR